MPQNKYHDFVERFSKIILDSVDKNLKDYASQAVKAALTAGVIHGIDSAVKVVKKEIEGAEETLKMDLVPGAKESAKAWLSTAKGILSGIVREKSEAKASGSFYTADEQRVVNYLEKIIPGIGAGDDPIGFLIASHEVLVTESKVIRTLDKAQDAVEDFMNHFKR